MSLKKEDIFEGRSYEEWLKEAAEIEAEIENVHLQENEADKERLRSQILMEIYQKEKENPGKSRSSRRILRYAAGFSVVLVGIFGFSMTSQANRTFLVEKVQAIFSDDADVRVKNEEVTVASVNEAKKAREDIEQTLELPVPEFFYIPKGMEFSGYEIHADVGIAEMRYTYQDKIITFHVSGNDENSVENRSVDGKIVDTVSLDREVGDIDILEVTNDVNSERMYSAQWIHNNCYYFIEGIIELEEFEKILKSLMF